MKMRTTSLIQSLLNQQAFRFICVGIAAAFTQFIIVILITELTPIHPLTSNIIGFLVAFHVSYTGHHYWTFQRKQASNQSFFKFFLTAIFSFLLNQGLFALLLLTSLPYQLSLLIVLCIVPPLTFLLSKYWAFKS